MSPLEIVAALLGLVTVALVVRRSVWNYPFALVMVLLYFFVFFDAKLYSDALLQVFFFAINAYGWWAWSRAPHIDDGVAVGFLDDRARWVWLAATIAGSGLLGWAMATYTNASAPYVDAAVAGSSVAAQLLQSLRRIESWLCWIVADLIAVPLYMWKGLMPTATLYMLFLAMAVAGFVAWLGKAESRVTTA
jgi:nicotinamide mononucleotide transporter